VSDLCPFDLCDGSGFRIDAAANTAYDCRCRAQRVARAKARNLSAVIPRRYRDVAFERPPVTDIDPQIVVATRRYAATIDEQLDAGRGLWFMGPVGTGKTTLAMLVSRAASDAGRSVAIYSLPSLLNEIRDTHRAERSHVDLLDRLAAVDLVAEHVGRAFEPGLIRPAADAAPHECCDLGALVKLLAIGVGDDEAAEHEEEVDEEPGIAHKRLPIEKAAHLQMVGRHQKRANAAPAVE